MTRASTRLTFEAEHLEQRIIRFAPGRSRERTADSRHDLLYVVAGQGELQLDGKRYPLDPGTGAFVAPGESYVVENPGPDDLLVVSVSATADLAVDEQRRKVTIRFDDQEEHTASVERTFRYLINEAAGCLDVTQFIGIVQPSKAPFHSHPYEELGYIVEGEGVAHVGGRSLPLAAGLLLPPAAGESPLHRERRAGADADPRGVPPFRFAGESRISGQQVASPGVTRGVGPGLTIKEGIQ